MSTLDVASPRLLQASVPQDRIMPLNADSAVPADALGHLSDDRTSAFDLAYQASRRDVADRPAGFRGSLARRRRLSLFVALGDMVMMFCAIRFWAGGANLPPGDAEFVAALAATAAVGLAAAGLRLYDLAAPDVGHAAPVLGLLLLVAISGAGTARLVADSLGGVIASDRMALACIGFAVAGVCTRKIALRLVRRRPQRVLIVGTGADARALARAASRPEQQMHVIGFLGDPSRPLDKGEPRVLGFIADIRDAVIDLHVERVIVAESSATDQHLLDELRACDGLDVEIDVVPRFADLMGRSAQVASIGRVPVVRVPPNLPGGPERAVKRLADLVGAAVLLTLLSPVMLLIAAWIAAADGRPIFFRQIRVGRAGRNFRIVKFRTMRVRDDPTPDLAGVLDGDVIKRRAAARVTPAGAFLRRKSLDELPQLWNVLRGDMSLVGPRPITLEELATLRGWRLRRHEARPGLTGLWQVTGRSDIGWDERMQIDYTYVRHWSLRLDLRILAATVRSVMNGRGAV